MNDQGSHGEQRILDFTEGLARFRELAFKRFTIGFGSLQVRRTLTGKSMQYLSSLRSVPHQLVVGGTNGSRDCADSVVNLPDLRIKAGQRSRRVRSRLHLLPDLFSDAGEFYEHFTKRPGFFLFGESKLSHQPRMPNETFYCRC